MKFCHKCNADTERGKRGNCKPCTKARSKAWAAANPEKRKASVAKWVKANPEKAKEIIANWEAQNPERVSERKIRWVMANPERAKSISATWAKENPEKNRIKSHNRRARLRVNGGELSSDIYQRLMQLQRGKCACGCKQPLGADYHLDHIMPVALGGTNEDANTQLLRGVCNRQKSAKHPVAFMQSRGYLI